MMYALNLNLKNGKSIAAMLYTWRPELGWIEALDESNGKVVKVALKDIDSGIIYSSRQRDPYTGEDLLEKARVEGWK